MKEGELKKVIRERVREVSDAVDELYDYAFDTLRKVYNVASRLARSESVSLEQINIVFITYLRVLVEVYHEFLAEVGKKGLGEKVRNVLSEVLKEME